MLIPTVAVWMIIAIGGSIGGLLYGIRDKRLYFPTFTLEDVQKKVKRKVVDLGCISDILFGLVGGFVIFLILPSMPNPNAEGPWEIIKILSLALVGGYGGRVLIEKVADERIKEYVDNKVNEKVDSKEVQDRFTDQAQSTLDKLLESNKQALYAVYEQLNTNSKRKKEEFVQLFMAASPNVRIQVSDEVKGYREHNIFALLGVSEDNAEVQLIKQKFDDIIPLLEALIEVESNNPQSHEYWAHLAYTYKDKLIPEWENALKCINKAIEERNNRNIDRDYWMIYELNRLICHINLKKYEDSTIEEDFNWLWNLEDGRKMLMTTHPILAPGLYDWVLKHKQEKAREWLKQHPNKKDRLIFVNWLKQHPDKKDEWHSIDEAQRPKKIDTSSEREI